MSEISRDRLRSLWESKQNERYLRNRALRLWCSTIGRGDIPRLRAVSADCDLGETALFQRLRRGDREAVAELTEKLPESDTGYWWQAGRHIWSDDLTVSLEHALERRRPSAEKTWDIEEAESSDWILSELLMELPTSTVEPLFSANWDHLKYSPYYVKAALYTCIPSLIEMARKAIAESKKPRRMLAHLPSAYGVKYKGRTGITRIAQLEVLVPYLNYLAKLDILSLWDVCNSHGWYRFRQQHLDSLIESDNPRRFTDDNRAMADLSNQLNQGSTFWARHWTERFLETGVSVGRMMDVVRIWLSRQTKIKALEMAADIVVHAGRRKHLSILRGHHFTDERKATAVTGNAEFAVKRRSLN